MRLQIAAWSSVVLLFGLIIGLCNNGAKGIPELGPVPNRIEAIEAIGHKGKAAIKEVPRLSALLGDPDKKIRIATALALARIAGKQWLPALVQVASFDDYQESRNKDLSLSNIALHPEMGTPAVPYLLDLLKDGDTDFKIAVLDYLDKIGDPSALRAIADTIRDEDYDVTEKALTVFHRSHDLDCTLGVLLDLVFDKTIDTDIRRNIVINAGYIRNRIKYSQFKHSWVVSKYIGLLDDEGHRCAGPLWLTR